MLVEVLKKESDFIKNHGGYFGMTEFDGGINDIQREKVKAYKEQHGQCFLGKVNYYGKDRENIDNIKLLIEYNGQMIYNFEYNFCVPNDDEVLKDLIKKLNKNHNDMKNIINDIDTVMDRIDELNGINLTWV